MSKLHSYGVVCKNPKCAHEIRLGTFRPFTTETRAGEDIDIKTIIPSRGKCPICGHEDTYTDDDFKDFGEAGID